MILRDQRKEDWSHIINSYRLGLAVFCVCDTISDYLGVNVHVSKHGNPGAKHMIIRGLYFFQTFPHDIASLLIDGSGDTLNATTTS